MSDIQRHDIEMDYEDGYDAYWTSVPCASGEWVKWDDVQSLLTERDALRQRIETLEGGITQIHQMLKRGERTQDHGALENLACIIDHLSDFPDALSSPERDPGKQP